MMHGQKNIKLIFMFIKKIKIILPIAIAESQTPTYST